MMSKLDLDESSGYFNSLRDRIFMQIENDILYGRYQPGESLIETKLSKELGVSRTPVREALRQLEREGLVQSIPNRGVIVKGISIQDIEDIYVIRTMIEGLAARWAAAKISKAEVQELKDVVDLQEFYTAKNESSQLLKLDSLFHDILFKASKSKPLMHTLSMFHHYIQRARSASLSTPGRAQRVLEEHKAILKAISEKDVEKAEKLTNEHIRNASINFLKYKEDLVQGEL